MSVTHSRDSRSDGRGFVCSACGAPQSPDHPYCGMCGHRLDDTDEHWLDDVGEPSATHEETTPTDDTTVPDAMNQPGFTVQPEGHPTSVSGTAPALRHRPTRPTLILATAAIVVLGGIAAATILLRQPRAQDVLLIDAAQTTQQLLVDIGQARTIEDLHDVADRADQQSTTVEAALPSLPGDDPTTQQLAAVNGMLSSLATLNRLNADRLATWSNVKAELLSAAAAIRDAPAEVTALVPQLGTATTATDATIATMQERMATWRRAVRRARRERAAHHEAVAQLNGYVDQVNSLLTEYRNLRTETDEFTKRIQDPYEYVTWQEAYDHFSAGAQARQSIRDQLDGLTPEPDLGLTEAHARLVRMLTSATDAMHAAYAGLNDSQSSGQYYADTFNWRQFQSESSRITDEFNGAQAEWGSALDRAYQRFGHVDLPRRPNL